MTQIEELKEIRNLMERSTRFLSLSWLSGVFSGVFALIGALFAAWYLNQLKAQDWFDMMNSKDVLLSEPIKVLLTIAFAVFVLAISATLFFTFKKAKRQGMRFWNATSKRLFINFMIPLLTGGAFSLILIFWGIGFMVAPTTLIFYGLALVNASKFTYSVTFPFGICEIILGLVSAFFIGYGLWFWAFGFGVLHILYGIVIYLKYEHGVSAA